METTTKRPYIVTALASTTVTPAPRARLSVPPMAPIDELCPGCYSVNVVLVGRHSSEGPKVHCRQCGCTA